MLNPCATTQQESVLPDLLLSYRDEIMRSRCGIKDKLKGQTPSPDCEEQAYLLHVHPEAADANHVRCFHDNQHLKYPVILEIDGKPKDTRLAE